MEYKELFFNKKKNQLTFDEVVFLNGIQDSLCDAIRHVIDCECYYVSGSHKLREVSIFTVSTKSVETFYIYYSGWEIPLKDRTVNHQITRIHGLPVVCWKRNKRYFTETEMKEILKNYFYFNSFVSYKGGDIEYDILRGLGVKCINLEVIGCDKYDVLLTHLLHPKVLTPYVCDEHTAVRGCHCSRYEVVLFYLWINGVIYRRDCANFYNSIMKK